MIIDKLAVKPLLILSGILLVLLLAVSWFARSQFLENVRKDGEHAAELQALRDAATIDGLTTAAAQSDALAAQAEAERAALVALFTDIAADEQRNVDAYWKRLSKIPPLPLGCAPTRARVEAFNARSD
jgi:hypothetical protein